MSKKDVDDAIQYAIDYTNEVGGEYSTLYPPVSDKEIEETEKELGLKIHEDFKYMIQTYGEFYTEGTCQFVVRKEDILSYTKTMREEVSEFWGEENEFSEILNECFVCADPGYFDYWLLRTDGTVWYWNTFEGGLEFENESIAAHIRWLVEGAKEYDEEHGLT